jgi:hypothetical protein
MQIHAFTVTLSSTTIHLKASDSDAAVDTVLEAQGASFDDFLSVYQEDPVPEASSKYGAPMGRMSRPMDYDNLEAGFGRASVVELDEGGYDAGGAYWGLRPIGQSLYAVQDGMGNIAFVDAKTSADALAQASA